MFLLKSLNHDSHQGSMQGAQKEKKRAQVTLETVKHLHKPFIENKF